MKLLDENTLVPLGLSVLVIGTASFWLSAINAKVEAHDKIILETKVKQEKTSDDLSQIRVDIGVIKQLLITNGKER